MKLFTMLVAGLLALSGCATPQSELLFVAVPDAKLAPPPPDKAQIVFMMPKDMFHEMNVTGLYDITGTDTTLMAMVPSVSKTAQLVTPGRHRFMAQFGSMAHVMEADVVAGKRYYVLVRFIFSQGFQLRPIRTSGPSDYSTANKDFPAWFSTRLVEKVPAADAWHTKFKMLVEKGRAEAVTVFDKKTAEQKAELTLNPGDAVAD